MLNAITFKQFGKNSRKFFSGRKEETLQISNLEIQIESPRAWTSFITQHFGKTNFRDGGKLFLPVETANENSNVDLIFTIQNFENIFWYNNLNYHLYHS